MRMREIWVEIGKACVIGVANAENQSRWKLKASVSYFLSNFIFSPYDSPSKTIKKVSYFIKKAFIYRDIQFVVFFSLPFHTFKIRKEKWKWNDL